MQRILSCVLLSGLLVASNHLCRPAQAGTYTLTKPLLPGLTQTVSYSAQTVFANGHPSVQYASDPDPLPDTISAEKTWSWTWTADPLIPNDTPAGVVAAITYHWEGVLDAQASTNCYAVGSCEFGGSAADEEGAVSYTRSKNPGGTYGPTAFEDEVTRSDFSYDANGSYIVGHSMHATAGAGAGPIGGTSQGQATGSINGSGQSLAHN